MFRGKNEIDLLACFGFSSVARPDQAEHALQVLEQTGGLQASGKLAVIQGACGFIGVFKRETILNMSPSLGIHL